MNTANTANTSTTSHVSPAVNNAGGAYVNHNDLAYQPRDPSDTLSSRLTAYKHVVDNLSSYFDQVKSHQKTLSKEWNKLGKTLDVPFKDANMFDEQGLSKIWATLLSEANNMSTFHANLAQEYETNFTKQLEGLKDEVKGRIKEFNGKAGVKGGKGVEKLRGETQSSVEALGKAIARSETSAGGLKSSQDPYIIHRTVLKNIEQQVSTENHHSASVVGLQNEIAACEKQITVMIQEVIAKYSSFAEREADTFKMEIHKVLETASSIPPDHEWNSFMARDKSLIDPNEPKRDAAMINFHNKDHETTKPFMESVLSRKGKLLKNYSSYHYVLTPAGFLHEFAATESSKYEDPSMSLYIPECRIAAPSAIGDKPKWSITGKDTSKTVSLTGKSTYIFKANSMVEAEHWIAALRKVSGATNNTDAYEDDVSESEEGVPVAAASQHSQPVISHTNQAVPLATTSPTTGVDSHVPHQTTAGASGLSNDMNDMHIDSHHQRA